MCEMIACRKVSVPNSKKHTDKNILGAIKIETPFKVRRTPSEYYRWTDEADGEKGKQKNQDSEKKPSEKLQVRFYRGSQHSPSSCIFILRQCDTIPSAFWCLKIDFPIRSVAKKSRTAVATAVDVFFLMR